jgi:hypothetical protein
VAAARAGPAIGEYERLALSAAVASEWLWLRGQVSEAPRRADRRGPGCRAPGGDPWGAASIAYWDTDSDSPGHDDLVRALVLLHRFAPAAITDPGRLRHYAEAARSLAATEIPGTFDPDLDTDEALRFSVLGTVLYEPVPLALRKLAPVDRIREVARDWPPPVENTTAN